MYDGDGAMLMHLGSLASIASLKPKNFRHILINNEVRESVGGQATAAKEINLSFHLRSISLEMLKSSDEVFATSTAGGIMPITKINGHQIGIGAPGKITRRLHKSYWDKHTDSKWTESVNDLVK